MFGDSYRQKGVDRLVEEIAYVAGRFRVKNIYFMDLEFGLDRDYVRSFCKSLIRENIDINWCCQTRVTDVDRSVLKWMKKAGCTLIHFGIESGSDRLLGKSGKGIRVADCLSALPLVHEAGIRSALFMNFGYPGETLEEMQATIDLAVRLNPTYAAFHLIVPFPGTRLAEDTGIDPEAFPINAYPHYNFVDHDLKTLRRVLYKAYLRFYLRPRFLLGILRNQTGGETRGQKGSLLNQIKTLARLISG
jgi:radical SAM superfamily enzyme YgiQ (UPF0313 family)